MGFMLAGKKKASRTWCSCKLKCWTLLSRFELSRRPRPSGMRDAVFEAVMARIAHWSSPEGSTYSLRRRNCINFVADIARTVGLLTAAENTLSPNGFLTGTAALNPAAAVALAGTGVTASPAISRATAPGTERGR